MAKTLRVVDLGSGSASRLELDIKESVVLDVTLCDIDDGLEGVDHQDMEKLTYEDNSFDIVHCRNALDHTWDAKGAVKEMIRVCKPGGTVFIKCWLAQKDTGHGHQWNAREDGVFTAGQESFDLRELGFKIRTVQNGGERRYDYIEATLEKPRD